jgi:hypothetical protein
MPRPEAGKGFIRRKIKLLRHGNLVEGVQADGEVSLTGPWCPLVSQWRLKTAIIRILGQLQLFKSPDPHVFVNVRDDPAAAPLVGT